MSSPPPSDTPSPRRSTRLGRAVRRWTIPVLLLFVALDAYLPPSRQALARGASGLVGVYQVVGRPVMSRITSCRFHPSCSDYSRQAFTQYGFWGGLWKTSSRIARCNPWATGGTHDPP